ncbi:hypothetical protein LTR93_011135 [Exophiala xenobiotica]|nr:hypothetical protein LTR93_011135 [Exophiala xenobiotica]
MVRETKKDGLMDEKPLRNIKLQGLLASRLYRCWLVTDPDYAIAEAAGSTGTSAVEIAVDLQSYASKRQLGDSARLTLARQQTNSQA